MNASMTGDVDGAMSADMGNDVAEVVGATRISGIEGLALFLSGWAAMMVAHDATGYAALDPALPHRRPSAPESPLAWIGMAVLFAGYITVWAVVSLPVYAYNLLAEGMGTMALLAGVLLIAGGAYQFTALKGACHARCSNPLFFPMPRWRPGTAGALRMGVLHGVDCLGCCVGSMVGLVALGMMNLVWMLTAALIVFVEKTLPGSHRISYPLGILMVAGGVALLGTSLFDGVGAT